MATKKNFKESADKVWDFLKEAGTIVLGILLAIIGCLLVSWPLFILLALIIPGFAAKLMYGKIEDNFPGFARKVQRLNGWIVFILPLYAKQRFIDERGLDRCSIDLQKAYYFKYRRSSLTISKMSCLAYRALWRDDRLEAKDYNPLISHPDAKDVFQSLTKNRQVTVYERLGAHIELIEMMTDDAVKFLWGTSRSLNRDYSNVVIAGRVLDDFMFEQLCREVPDMVGKYVVKHTPSDAMMIHILTYYRENYDDIIRYCISRYGLSPKVIKEMGKMNLLEEYDNSLRQYMERTFLQRHSNESDKEIVKSFFADKRDLTVAAQVVLKPWQYRLFHEAGLELDDTAIEGFLEKEDIAMIKVIFELDPDVAASDVAETMAMANPKLVDLILSFKKPE